MKILVAEDEMISRRLLEALLTKWGYEIALAGNGAEAWQFLQQADAPRLALLDWMMPEMDGLEVCRRLRQREGRPYVYVLLLTARTQKQDLLKALEAGADDYLTKPYDVEELRARLFAGQRIVELQDRLLGAQEALHFQATHDPLTSLCNRGEILEILDRELSRSQRQHTSLSVVLTDVDHFKRINDSCGHLVGDAALREAARRMLASVRLYDSVGRYGGEEFLVVSPSTDALGALAQAERIRCGIDSVPIQSPAGELRLTASLGIAVSSGGGALDAPSLLRAADAALYRAKAKGRNRAELATPAELAHTAVSTPALRSA